MSSRSLQTFSPESVAVIGGSWRSLLLAKHLCDQGVTPIVLSPANGPNERTLPVYLGNGETRGRANLTFGYQLTDTLWELSERNYSRAKALTHTLGVACSEGVLRWTDQKDLSALNIDFPGLAEALLSSLQNKGVKVATVEHIQVHSLSELSQEVRYSESGVERTLSPVMLICAEEYWCQNLFGFMADKLVVATRSSFLFRKLNCPEFELALFNDGVDFAIPRGADLELGSFRNLYADHGVGVQSVPDARTREGVRGFFSGLGWVDADVEKASYTSVEAVSCDGLPIVGTLPDMPGACVLAGFAARSQNFFFEISHGFVAALLEKNDFSDVSVFSTKRFL